MRGSRSGQKVAVSSSPVFPPPPSPLSRIQTKVQMLQYYFPKKSVHSLVVHIFVLSRIVYSWPPPFMQWIFFLLLSRFRFRSSDLFAMRITIPWVCLINALLFSCCLLPISLMISLFEIRCMPIQTQIMIYQLERNTSFHYQLPRLSVSLLSLKVIFFYPLYFSGVITFSPKQKFFFSIRAAKIEKSGCFLFTCLFGFFFFFFGEVFYSDVLLSWHANALISFSEVILPS